MAMFGVKGEKVGQIIERVQRDALMNRFDWRDRDAAIDYVSSLEL